jgi:hypothetical protein
MLPNYGVLIGNFVSSSREQGQWLHAILNMNVAGTAAQCSVDVNEPTLGFQYHCNQGDPKDSHWYPHNGIWQEGCVFALMQDGTLSAYLGMFMNQTLNTDNNGNPP